MSVILSTESTSPLSLSSCPSFEFAASPQMNSTANNNISSLLYSKSSCTMSPLHSQLLNSSSSTVAQSFVNSESPTHFQFEQRPHSTMINKCTHANNCDRGELYLTAEEFREVQAYIQNSLNQRWNAMWRLQIAQEELQTSSSRRSKKFPTSMLKRSSSLSPAMFQNNSSSMHLQEDSSLMSSKLRSSRQPCTPSQVDHCTIFENTEAVLRRGSGRNLEENGIYYSGGKLRDKNMANSTSSVRMTRSSVGQATLNTNGENILLVGRSVVTGQKLLNLPEWARRMHQILVRLCQEPVCSPFYTPLLPCSKRMVAEAENGDNEKNIAAVAKCYPLTDNDRIISTYSFPSANTPTQASCAQLSEDREKYYKELCEKTFPMLPLNLETILKRLERNEYIRCNEVFNDVYTVFLCAFRIYEPGNQYWMMAQEASLFFKKLIQNESICKDDFMPLPKSLQQQIYQKYQKASVQRSKIVPIFNSNQGKTSGVSCYKALESFDNGSYTRNKCNNNSINGSSSHFFPLERHSMCNQENHEFSKTSSSNDANGLQKLSKFQQLQDAENSSNLSHQNTTDQNNVGIENMFFRKKNTTKKKKCAVSDLDRTKAKGNKNNRLHDGVYDGVGAQVSSPVTHDEKAAFQQILLQLDMDVHYHLYNAFKGKATWVTFPNGEVELDDAGTSPYIFREMVQWCQEKLREQKEYCNQPRQASGEVESISDSQAGQAIKPKKRRTSVEMSDSSTDSSEDFSDDDQH